MATVTLAKFYRSAMPTSSQTLATVPAGKTWAVTNIIVTNSAATAQTATVTLNGVSLIPAVSVNATAVDVYDIKQVLNAGETITGFASSGSVTCHISGAEIA